MDSVQTKGRVRGKLDIASDKERMFHVSESRVQDFVTFELLPRILSGVACHRNLVCISPETRSIGFACMVLSIGKSSFHCFL